MHVVIIGDGVAGQTVVETLHRLNPHIKITVLTEEAYSFYTRIYLPHYIVRQRPLEKIILRQPLWYQQNGISLLLNARVMAIDRKNKEIQIQFVNQDENQVINQATNQTTDQTTDQTTNQTTDQTTNQTTNQAVSGHSQDKTAPITSSTASQTEKIAYDKLVIATGSNPRRMSFGAPATLQGIFALRRISDAHHIQQYIEEQKVSSIVIIGGGLLGIELGYHLKEIVETVTICEIAEYLLPRQLDRETSAILTQYLTKKGLHIICGKKIQKIYGNSHVEAIELDNRDRIETQMIFQQLGIIPQITLAKEAGLQVNKGIIVNEYLQTSDPDIYGAGDCIEFDGLVWGIIPACMEQAKIVAKRLANEPVKAYNGTYWNTRLKIAGLNVSCIGISPENLGDTHEEVKIIDSENYLCRKVFISKQKIKGAIIVGDANDAFFRKNMDKEVNREELEEKMAFPKKN